MKKHGGILHTHLSPESVNWLIAWALLYAAAHPEEVQPVKKS